MLLLRGLVKWTSENALVNKCVIRSTGIFTGTSYPNLKYELAQRVSEERRIISEFRTNYGTKKIGDVTVEMVFGGMAGLKGLITETSCLDANLGIKFRGKTVPELRESLPRVKGGSEPLPESIFWLLLTKNVPKSEQISDLSKELAARSSLPDHIVDLLNNLPTFVSPIAQLISALAVLSSQSRCLSRIWQYEAVEHASFWEFAYEDAINLIAKLPKIVSIIYRNLYRSSEEVVEIPEIDHDLDWAHNLAKMLGYQNDENFVEFLRLFLTIQSDFDGGDVVIHASRLVGSTLSDPYLSLLAGMAGLAGPLSYDNGGKFLSWLEEIEQKIGSSPSDGALAEYVKSWVKENGCPIPGKEIFLLKPDSRYLALQNFAETRNLVEKDASLQLISRISMILGDNQKPWPSVDAYSGALFQHFGLKERAFHPLIFGVSRSLGISAQLIWDRALDFPIERPRSQTTQALMKLVGFSPKK